MRVIEAGRGRRWARSDWLVLVGVSLLYVFAGLWLISRIFPGGQAAPSGADTNNRKGPKT